MHEGRPSSSSRSAPGQSLGVSLRADAGRDHRGLDLRGEGDKAVRRNRHQHLKEMQDKTKEKTMSIARVEEIQVAIESLPYQEYVRLRQWLSERDWAKWDRQIEADSESGKLDFLIEEALNEEEENANIPCRNKGPTQQNAYDPRVAFPGGRESRSHCASP